MVGRENQGREQHERAGPGLDPPKFAALGVRLEPPLQGLQRWLQLVSEDGGRRARLDETLSQPDREHAPERRAGQAGQGVRHGSTNRLSQWAVWQRQAKMDASGGSNSNTVAVAMGRLLLAALADKPTEAVLFMPLDEQVKSSMPLRITDMRIEGEPAELIVSLSPMTPAERGAFFDGIVRGP